MGLKMTYVRKHKKTGKWQYRRPTPPDLLAKRRELGAMGIKVTLEFKHSLKAVNDNDAELKGNEANKAVLLKIDAMRNALANGPSSLTQKQIAALAGDIARQILKSDAEVGDTLVDLPQGGGRLKVSWADTVDLFKLIELHGLDRYPGVEATVAKLIQSELLKKGIIAISDHTSEQLKARIVKDLPNVAKMLAAIQDDGDYREPEWVKGRPKLQEAFSKSAAKVTFKQLIEGWRRDRSPKPASVKAYEHWCAAFVRWRGNDDAATIMRKDMIAWKEAMQSEAKLNGKGIKLKLEGVRSILEWGIANEKLPYVHNPARGVTVAASKSKKKGWPDEQASLILMKAREQSGYLRWAPLLMAVTGARAGEIAQLRLSDLKEDVQGRWSVTILPEAGTVKTDAGERTIPLHSAVIKEGFPRYVLALDKATDLLFPSLYSAPKRKQPAVSEAEANRISRLSGDQMRRWLYGPQVGLKPDKRYSPRHAWRHRISSLMREHCPSDAEARLAALLGHANESITSRYGNAPPLRWIREGIESIPRDALFGKVWIAKSKGRKHSATLR